MARLSKSQRALLKAFGENYLLLEHDGGFLLYDTNRKGYRSNNLYLGKFYLATATKGYAFNDNYYTTIDSLVFAMEEYNKTLPFEAENYNPMYRKHYCIECCIIDYLHSLGFKEPESMYINQWSILELKDLYGQVICSIAYTLEEDTTKGRVQRLIGNGDRWTEASFTDLESAIGACNSLISAYCLPINITIEAVLSKLTHARATEMLDKTFDYNSLSVYEEDAKEKLIKYLEEELKRLKEE